MEEGDEGKGLGACYKGRDGVVLTGQNLECMEPSTIDE